MTWGQCRASLVSVSVSLSSGWLNGELVESVPIRCVGTARPPGRLRQCDRLPSLSSSSFQRPAGYSGWVVKVSDAEWWLVGFLRCPGT